MWVGGRGEGQGGRVSKGSRKDLAEQQNTGAASKQPEGSVGSWGKGKGKEALHRRSTGGLLGRLGAWNREVVRGTWGRVAREGRASLTWTA